MRAIGGSSRCSKPALVTRARHVKSPSQLGTNEEPKPNKVERRRPLRYSTPGLPPERPVVSRARLRIRVGIGLGSGGVAYAVAFEGS